MEAVLHHQRCTIAVVVVMVVLYQSINMEKYRHTVQCPASASLDRRHA